LKLCFGIEFKSIDDDRKYLVCRSIGDIFHKYVIPRCPRQIHTKITHLIADDDNNVDEVYSPRARRLFRRQRIAQGPIDTKK